MTNPIDPLRGNLIRSLEELSDFDDWPVESAESWLDGMSAEHSYLFEFDHRVDYLMGNVVNSQDEIYAIRGVAAAIEAVSADIDGAADYYQELAVHRFRKAYICAARYALHVFRTNDEKSLGT